MLEKKAATAPQLARTQDKTATKRQRARRAKIRKEEGLRVGTTLNKAQLKKLDDLLAEGFAPNKSAVLAKCLDEVHARVGATNKGLAAPY